MKDPHKHHSVEPRFLVVAAVLLWSTGGLFIKLTSLNAAWVNLGRSLFAAITVAIFTYRRGLLPDRFSLFSSFLYAGTLTCFVYANKYTTAANAIFLQYTAPIYILVLAPFVLKEKFRKSDLFSVLVCMAGMGLFFIGDKTSATAPNILLGNIIALVSGVFFGLYVLFVRHHRSLQRNPAMSVFYGNLLVVAVMLPVAIYSPPSHVGLTDAAAILFLGVIQIGLAYILFTNGLSRGVRSLDASLIGFIEPLFNPVWVFLFVGETPSKWAALGGSIILATIAVHSLIGRRRDRALDPLIPAAISD
jgi:drug/metabolite transporter (DMT)-like permease